jgi:hypothetical protein
MAWMINIAAAVLVLSILGFAVGVIGLIICAVTKRSRRSMLIVTEASVGAFLLATVLGIASPTANSAATPGVAMVFAVPSLALAFGYSRLRKRFGWGKPESEEVKEARRTARVEAEAEWRKDGQEIAVAREKAKSEAAILREQKKSEVAAAREKEKVESAILQERKKAEVAAIQAKKRAENEMSPWDPGLSKPPATGLIYCATCGVQIAASAPSCPHCGHQYNQSSGAMSGDAARFCWVMLGVFIVVVIIYFFITNLHLEVQSEFKFLPLK